MAKTLVVDCPYCESKVDCEVVGENESFDPREDPAPFRASLVKCPGCSNSLVAGQERYQDEWTKSWRLWPTPRRVLSWDIPSIVKVSLEEADRCYNASAYTACAVMCGRSLEGVCVDHRTKSKTLANGLKELREKHVIDERLYTWGDELRKVRNLGAHASEERVSKQDASDVLDFLHAICEYVYVLNKKFDNFMARRNSGK